MQSLSKLKTNTPQQQKDKFSRLVRHMHSNPAISMALKKCGLGLSPEQVIVEGECMEDVHLSNGAPATRANLMKRDKSGKKLCFGKGEWVFIYPGRMFNQADALYNEIQTQGRQMGVEFGEPEWGELKTNKEAEYQA